MSAHDNFCRPYALLDELKVGDTVIVDEGFTCMAKWSERVVYANASTGELTIACKSGGHGLEGQLDQDTNALVGIYKAEEFKPRPGERATRKPTAQPLNPEPAGREGSDG